MLAPELSVILIAETRFLSGQARVIRVSALAALGGFNSAVKINLLELRS